MGSWGSSGKEKGEGEEFQVEHQTRPRSCGHLQLHSELKASLDYVETLSGKTKTQTKARVHVRLFLNRLRPLGRILLYADRAPGGPGRPAVRPRLEVASVPLASLWERIPERCSW